MLSVWFAVYCGVLGGHLPDVPYDLSPEFVEQLFTKHKIDYIIHGDDPCLLPDGTDAYAYAKKLGRFKMVRAHCTQHGTGSMTASSRAVHVLSVTHVDSNVVPTGAHTRTGGAPMQTLQRLCCRKPNGIVTAGPCLVLGDC